MSGAKIPADHPHGFNYLLLLDIVDIVFAPVCTADIATYLRELIHEHHSTFQELYPHCPNCAEDALYDTYPGMDYKVGIKILIH